MRRAIGRIGILAGVGALVAAAACNGTDVTDATNTPSATDTTSGAPTTPATPSGSIAGSTFACLETGVNASPFKVANAMAANTADHEASADYTYSATGATTIALTGTGATVTGTGATASGGTITIANAGTYIVSGTLSNGQLVVNTSDTGTVRVVLNGASITNSASSAITSTKAKKTVIVLAAGTTNTVVDGTTYPAGIDPNAAIWSKGNLSIGGTGSLVVKGQFEDGIGTKDGLVIASGTITVTAKDDGLRGKDYLVIRGGTIVATAGGDGIKSDEDEDAKLGYVRIQGGTITVTSAGDAISAETDALIEGGTIATKTAGGNTVRISDTLSAKGIKSGVLLVIDGGTLALDDADDALHSNGTLVVNGGTTTIATDDDGVHADTVLTINAGTITITKSYEGFENGFSDMTFNGGNIHVTSSDDAINLSGAGDNVRAAATYTMRINGGRIVVNSAGDGLDANGSIAMTGGCVLVSGPTANNNASLDYDGTFTITGGILAAAGSSGMAQAPGTTSTQNGMQLTFGTTRAANTLVQLRNAAGEDLLTWAPPKAFQSFVFSSPKLATGSSIGVYFGGTSTGTATDGWYQGGTYSGGTLSKTVSITGPVNRVSM